MRRQALRFANREEWLAARSKGIGASEVATIVGLNPWQTPYQLWRLKVGIDPPKAENFAMKAGHYLEDAVASFWHDATGKDIIKASKEDFMYVDEERPFLRVSPDRTYWLGEGRGHDEKGILECKTTQMSVDPENLPRHWFCQVQMNLGVAGFEHGSLAWLTQGREFGYQNINFAPDFFAWLSEEVAKFWIDCVEGKQEPEVINVADVLLKYNRHTDGRSVEVSDEVFAAYQELKDVRKELDALDERKEALEGKIKMAFADAEAITYGGETLATWKAPKPSNKFDAKAFQSAHPDLAKEFTHPSQGARRFLLK